MRTFQRRSEVLVHWKDGLYYVGHISKLEKNHEQCTVTFEDGTVDVIRARNIYPAAEEGEITCDICGTEESEPPNEIVLCDNCHYGYHQCCHTPAIGLESLSPDVPWHCRRCVFTAAVQVGGAPMDGPIADALRTVKSHLPYKLEELQWDDGHKSNIDCTFCYCGGPGEWYAQMLQCTGCRQWFHEACIQCLQSTVLYGDRFYVFLCAVCNGGDEFIYRISMSRDDAVHLAIFNLTLTKMKKYFEATSEVCSWMRASWTPLVSGAVASSGPQPLPYSDVEVYESLVSDTDRFACAMEIRKSKSLFGLRVCAPPHPPVVELPLEKPVTVEMVRKAVAAAAKPAATRRSRESSPVQAVARKRRRAVATTDARDDASLKSALQQHSVVKGAPRGRRSLPVSTVHYDTAAANEQKPSCGEGKSQAYNGYNGSCYSMSWEDDGLFSLPLQPAAIGGEQGDCRLQPLVTGCQAAEFRDEKEMPLLLGRSCDVSLPLCQSSALTRHQHRKVSSVSFNGAKSNNNGSQVGSSSSLLDCKCISSVGMMSNAAAELFGDSLACNGVAESGSHVENSRSLLASVRQIFGIADLQDGSGTFRVTAKRVGANGVGVPLFLVEHGHIS